MVRKIKHNVSRSIQPPHFFLAIELCCSSFFKEHNTMNYRGSTFQRQPFLLVSSIQIYWGATFRLVYKTLAAPAFSSIITPWTTEASSQIYTTSSPFSGVQCIHIYLGFTFSWFIEFIAPAFSRSITLYELHKFHLFQWVQIYKNSAFFLVYRYRHVQWPHISPGFIEIQHYCSFFKDRPMKPPPLLWCSVQI